MKTILRHRGIGGLLFAQSQVAFNDNATKLILIGLVQMLLPMELAGKVVSVIALLLVSPFVLFAPLSGWMADHLPRRGVLSGALWLQLAVMLVLIGGTLLQSLPVAIGGFFLLGLQAALMAPARRGMVKDLAGHSVGQVVGWMEMLGIAAILAGSLAGGQLIDGLTASLNAPWTAALISFAILAGTSAVALYGFRHVPGRPAANKAPFRWNSVFGHVALLSTLRRDRAIWRAALGDSMFYLGGGMLLLTLSQAGRLLFPDGLGAARMTGFMLATMGVGIAAGSIVAAQMSRRRILLALVPFGAFGLAATLGVLATLTPGGVLFFAALFSLGIFGGLFLVPLGAFLVDRAPDQERGSILAASGMLSSITGVAAVGLHALAHHVFGLGISGQLLVLAVLFFLTALGATQFLAQDVLRIIALSMARIRYSITSHGAEHIPVDGGALIICNHVSYVDTLVLSLASPRPIRFLSYDAFFKIPVLGGIMRLSKSIPVSSTKARDAILRAGDAIRTGEIVCIFPEGELTRTGNLHELKGGFELIARRAKCPVIVAHLDGLWGSIFSYEGGRYFTKWPKGLRRKTTVAFSRPFGPEEVTAPRARETMLELGEASFRTRTMKRSLASQLVRALESNPWRIALCDPSSPKKELRGGDLLALAWPLARRWRATIADHRVGIILPPGLAGGVANVAVILAGKVPVNLNPGLGAESVLACLKQAGIGTILTASIVVKKIPQFPWPANILLIESELATFSKFQRVWTWLQCAMLPASILERRMGHAREFSDREAVLLFTSGSSGTPKGVALTERHLLSNLAQVGETGFLQREDRILSALPLFHSFGLTMGLFFPLLAGRTVITAPSPLDSEKVAAAARYGLPTVLLSTPTFLRSYTKRVSRDAFGTLRLAVTGAERLPAETASAFRARFGCEVYEGYGLTEASPVVSLNMPNPSCGRGADSLQQGRREGSVGRIAPGIAIHLLDPVTEDPRPGATSGLLALRGPNIIASYMNDQSPEKFRDGWLITGDVVRVDEEGFLFIEGRISRFSKVGGEMISHSAVESALARLAPQDSAQDSAQDCVLGRPCAEKGEELVLLTTRAITRPELLKCLSGHIPNLWIPKEVIIVEHLPTLGSGKLDLAECRRLITHAITKE